MGSLSKILSLFSFAMGIMLGGCNFQSFSNSKNASATWSQVPGSGVPGALSQSNLVYSGPLVITHGGTYTGNYTSTDPTVPVIFVNTTEPVIIENCNLKSDGAALITTTDVRNLNWRIDTDLIVRNCNFLQ